MAISHLTQCLAKTTDKAKATKKRKANKTMTVMQANTIPHMLYRQKPTKGLATKKMPTTQRINTNTAGKHHDHDTMQQVNPDMHSRHNGQMPTKQWVNPDTNAIGSCQHINPIPTQQQQVNTIIVIEMNAPTVTEPRRIKT